MSTSEAEQEPGMFAGLADIHAFRQGAREFGATAPRALAHLPTGTYDTIPVPAEAGVPELMLYRPAGVPGPWPVYVNLHGGGFVLGDWEPDDPYCRFIADTAGCAVVNLDYVTAPEHPFPAAIDQTYTLLTWLHRHGSDLGLDGDRLAVGGHSAGGNISAAVSLRGAGRADFPLRGQIIDYAPLDLMISPRAKPDPDPAPDPVWREFVLRSAERFNTWYLSDPEQARDPLASPILAPDLSGLPPALVITAGLDVLGAEGDAYATRLEQAGVPTEHVSYDGCTHAFTHIGPEDAALDAWQRMAAFLRRVLA
ncbi:alpha/beta hydrolase [Actinoplanes subtropicus]|uniref:alpha/beta hydrolase n=1 Tax=Actinoplanes subtropicus TaxID=543632 RepID=UPI000691B1A4|nr:alpha/beta hydrolase [Actinoplanes subtropicus]